MTDKTCVFTEYLKYRADLRGFDLIQIEHILRYSKERYFDIETHRWIVIGEQGNKLVMIPYEESQTAITPVTIHTTSRQQIKFRLTTGRLTYE
ncbi:conserved hypothetical protein [Crenothrix polyspora]|jgi:hypothetical protein|uniref:Uncharacterized protein n=1 Tax=Crenothrix polyspora TaxID=360316 RepID=A0A1R4HCZ5_9GAMM|nr:hypothetical protein [Crenothrix polyspora]SJM94118.1 conserved hypothetical protein [Crenothrix polyspora]